MLCKYCNHPTEPYCDCVLDDAHDANPDDEPSGIIEAVNRWASGSDSTPSTTLSEAVFDRFVESALSYSHRPYPVFPRQWLTEEELRQRRTAPGEIIRNEDTGEADAHLSGVRYTQFWHSNEPQHLHITTNT